MGCTVRALACAVRTAAGCTDARWRAPAAVVCPWAMHERRTTAQTSKLTRSGLDRRGVCFSRFGAPRPRCCRLWPHPMSTIALSAVFWPHPGCNTSCAIARTLDSALMSIAVIAGHHCHAVLQYVCSSVAWNHFHHSMGFSTIPAAERATTGRSGAMRFAGSASSRDIAYMIHETHKIAHKYDVTSSNTIVLPRSAAAARSSWAGGARAPHAAITLCCAGGLAQAIAHSVARSG